MKIKLLLLLLFRSWNNCEMKISTEDLWGRKIWYKRFSHCNFIFSQLHLKAKRIKNFPQIRRGSWKEVVEEERNEIRLFYVGVCKEREREGNDNEIMIFFPCIFPAINFPLVSPLLCVSWIILIGSVRKCWREIPRKFIKLTRGGKLKVFPLSSYCHKYVVAWVEQCQMKFLCKTWFLVNQNRIN